MHAAAYVVADYECFQFYSIITSIQDNAKIFVGFEASRNTAKFHCHFWHLTFNREKDELKVYFYNLQIFYNPYKFFTW